MILEMDKEEIKPYYITYLTSVEKDGEFSDIGRTKAHVFIPHPDVTDDWETGEEIEVIGSKTLCGNIETPIDESYNKILWDEFSKYGGYTSNCIECKTCKRLFEKKFGEIK